MKKLFLAAAVAVVATSAFVQRAEAQPISRNNPYRALNHTGANYGAQQWQKRQAQSSGRSGTYRSGPPATSGIANAPSGRWSYSSAYRGAPARPVAPNCR